MGISNQTFKLSLNDTQVLKGIALLLLLCHHCWYTGEGFDDIVVYGQPVFKQIGIFGKLCVSLFVFLSGYGLTVGAIKNNGVGKIMQFYRKRYLKLMVNYWFVWLLFVPLGVFVFDRTFPAVYGENYVFKALADFLGLHSVIIGSSYGYNATWWFYSCIILLYVLYPLIWKCRNYWFLLILFALLIPVFGKFLRNGGSFRYLLPFVCGISYAYVKIPLGNVNIVGKSFLVVIFILLCVYRFFVSNAIPWETVIILWGVYLYKNLSEIKVFASFLSFLGKHSFNIFLFHTFIYGYYFHDYIYWSSNPIVIVSTLLVVCIIISIIIEFLKKKLGINTLQAKLIN